MSNETFWKAVGPKYSIEVTPFGLLDEYEERVLAQVKLNLRQPLVDEGLLLDFIDTYNKLPDGAEYRGILRCDPKEFYNLCCKWRDIHAMRLVLTAMAENFFN